MISDPYLHQSHDRALLDPALNLRDVIVAEDPRIQIPRRTADLQILVAAVAGLAPDSEDESDEPRS